MERPAIDVEALRSALGDRWERIEVVDSTGSTNADLIADTAAPDRSLLAAEDQTAGRGRLDRSWVTAPRAGLTFSVLLRPPSPVATWGWLPLLAGVALRDAVEQTTGVATALKWPNDLLAAGDERKLAGILAQTTGEAVVIGIGLNVTTTAEELGLDTASSLALCGVEADRTELLAAIAARLDRRFSQWSDVNGDAEACGLAEDYRHACLTLWREVRVSTLDGDTVSGQAVEIDRDGRLVVDTADGSHVIGAGDVQHASAQR